MRKIVIAIVVALISVSAVSQAQAPTAGPESKRLAYFVGTWNFSGQAQASPMGPAGPITFKEVCELLEGGFALICRSDGKSPMGATRSVSIMSYDMEKKSYSYTAAESNSPVFTAAGQVKGSAWIWRADSNMGGKKMSMRVTVTEGGPKGYDFMMEMSMDGGAFTQIMSGKSTKAS